MFQHFQIAEDTQALNHNDEQQEVNENYNDCSSPLLSPNVSKNDTYEDLQEKSKLEIQKTNILITDNIVLRPPVVNQQVSLNFLRLLKQIILNLELVQIYTSDNICQQSTYQFNDAPNSEIFVNLINKRQKRVIFSISGKMTKNGFRIYEIIHLRKMNPYYPLLKLFKFDTHYKHIFIDQNLDYNYHELENLSFQSLRDQEIEEELENNEQENQFQKVCEKNIKQEQEMLIQNVYEYGEFGKVLEIADSPPQEKSSQEEEP